MTTLHDFGGVLGQPLDTFFWALNNFMITALGLCVKVALNIVFSVYDIFVTMVTYG